MISLSISLPFVCIHAYSDNRGFVLGLNRGRESDANVKVNRDPPGEKLACLLLQCSQSECVLRLIRVCGFVRAHERSDVCDISMYCQMRLGFAEADSHSEH